MIISAVNMLYEGQAGLLSSGASQWALALTAVVTMIALTSWRWRMVWQYRHVPSSKGTYIPLIGDIVSITTEDLSYFMDRLSRMFPKAYKFWMGPYPWVVLTDIELARKYMMRYMNRPNLGFVALRRPRDQLLVASNEVFLNGGSWRIQRRATEGVVLHAKALAAQVPFVSQVTARLVNHLSRFAATGEPVDVQEAMWMMTIDAVGGAAFGVDLRASEYSDNSPHKKPDSSIAAAPADPDDHVSLQAPLPSSDLEDKYWEKYPVGSPEFGRGLVHSTRRCLQDQDMTKATLYTPLAVLLPELKYVWQWMARVLPDAKFLYTTSGHEGLEQGCKKIIETWKAQQAAGHSNGTVSSGGLLARALSDTTHDSELAEHEILGLVIGTVVAGYETTGTTIAMALYHLATHPDTQRKAQQEVDHVLQGKDPVMEDLEQLPYINGVIQETLRLYPPGTSVIREVMDDPLDLGDGIIVPKGARLVFPTFSYMRDPSIWPRALEFLPERHIQPGNEQLAPSNWNAFMPFGHGSRLCVGYKFALLESRMAMARMMQRFNFETIQGAPPPKMRTSITFKPDAVMLQISRREGETVA